MGVVELGYVDYYASQYFACLVSSHPIRKQGAYDYLRILLQMGWLTQRDINWFLGTKHGEKNAQA